MPRPKNRKQEEELELVLFRDKTEHAPGYLMAQLLDDCRNNNFWRLPEWK